MDYPTTPGAFQSTNKTAGPSRLGPSYEPVVTKLNPTGTALVYSTYLGGSGSLLDTGTTLKGNPVISEFPDYLSAIAVDAAGNAYVAGSSGSSDYPVTPGALQSTNREIGTSTGYWTSVFSELNPAGTGLVYSTYFGGSTSPRPQGVFFIGDGPGNWPPETADGIALDGKGNVFVAGTTSASDFPVTPDAADAKLTAGADQSNHSNAYLAVFNPASPQLVYSTYLGGSGWELERGVAYGAQGAYLVGNTASGDFPTTPNAFQTTPTGAPITVNGVIQYNLSGFITKIGFDSPGRILTRTVLTLGSTASQPSQSSLLATITPLTIAPAEPILTGTVTFTNNGSPVGAPVPVGSPITTASLTTSLATSPASLGCTYSGDTYYANSNCILPPDFAIVLANPTVTLKSGDHTSTSATLSSINGFADTISVVCGKLAHLACQVTPASTPLAANGTATLSLYLDTAPALAQNRPLSHSPIQFALLLLPLGLLANRRLRRTGSRYALVWCALALSLATLALSGCGQMILPDALPSGTYTIPITATGKTTGVTHTVQLILNVTR